jgi:hypothetical protein
LVRRKHHRDWPAIKTSKSVEEKGIRKIWETLPSTFKSGRTSIMGGEHSLELKRVASTFDRRHQERRRKDEGIERMNANEYIKVLEANLLDIFERIRSRMGRYNKAKVKFMQDGG